MLLATTNNHTKIASIVAKSRTLTERLSCSSTSNTVTNSAKVESRLNQWCQVVAQGDFAKFEKRLAWAGLDIETIRPILADREPDELEPLPSWAKTLEQIIDKAQALSHEQRFASQGYLNSKEPVPFEQIYLPCLQVARGQLLAKVGDRPILTDSARYALERQLLMQLNHLCFATLKAEFSAFRLSESATDFVLSNIINNDRREKYDAFIEQLFADGLLSLFEKYSVLGRLVATAVDLWVDATNEFCDRLAANWSEIESRFSPKRPLKQVVEIKTGLSDPHNGCRTVIILTFNTGIKLVYKPRDIGIDVAFFQLLDWFNAQKKILPFKVLQVLNYGSHGWIEYVEQLPCSDSAAVKRFYQRAGILLCLVHLLEGTDCHNENIIASGEHPIAIDIETLFHHRTQSFNQFDTTARGLVETQLGQSVLQTWILPKWGLSPRDSLTIDFGALGKTTEQKFIVSKVQNINTDGMHIGSEYCTTKQANVPVLAGESHSAEDYLVDIVSGFRQMYDFLSNHRELLLATDSPLMNFADRKVRYVFRGTRIYQTILNKSLTPDFLKSGIDRSIELDVLSRAFIVGDEKPNLWSILDAELQAMAELDIPCFTAKTSQTSIELSTKITIPKLFTASSFATVISRLKSLSEDDLNKQIEIIHGSFCARFIKEPIHVLAESKADISWLSNTLLTSEQLVQEAIILAQDLQQRGVYADDSVSWIGLGLRTNYQDFQLQSLSHNLYDGSCGVALFFAALAKVTSNSDWRDLALKTLQPLLHHLRDANPRTLKELTRLGIGGATGLGSVVYSLVQISHLMADADLTKDAKTVASLITTDLIKGDRNFDLMNGTAGMILACLKLYEVEPSALEQAILGGEHLIEHQNPAKDRLKPGLSQGAAGMAYALLRLYAVTQDSRFFDRAKEMISYEQNWQTSNSQKFFYNSWANGAAGIGLGRLGSMSIFNTEVIRLEIELAVTTAQDCCLEDLDNLAWGNLGRIETLLVASQKLNRPELLDFGLKATGSLVRQAQLRGRFNLSSRSIPVAYNPGFFQGTSGIGYQLLRIAYPNLLPSILLWS